jgi:hypothetical protein
MTAESKKVYYCIPSYRKALERPLREDVPGGEIEWVCFANDLDAANWNVTNRKNKSDAETHRGINGRLHPLYVCTVDTPILPIHRIAPSDK